jgi:copper chaperone CopZ
MRGAALLVGGLVAGGALGAYATARGPALRSAVTGEGALATASETKIATKTVSLKITGMTCEGCAAAIKIAAKTVDGVSDTVVDYPKSRADVTYDPARTTPQAIAAAITQESGFAATIGEAAPAKASVAMSPLTLPTVRDAFNASVGDTRVVTILSPSCPECQAGQSVVGRAFTANRSDRLKGFVVWLSMRAGDSADAAGRQAAEFTDARVQQGWDSTGAIGDAFAKTLALKGRAWDVYAVYGPGARWTGDTPPAPTFWMHQLTAAAGADQSLCLNPTAFLREIDRIAKGSTVAVSK